MSKKKHDIIKQAHRLFVEQGYHATSIQEILTRSEISKGTFYNYFSSKGELLKDTLTLMRENMMIMREKIHFEKEKDSVDVFIEQMIYMMKYNNENKINVLIDDAIASNDSELITFIRETKTDYLIWVYRRFQSIFPKEQSPYLIDGVVSFIGMMMNCMRTNQTLNHTTTIEKIICYCVYRTKEILNTVSRENIQLFDPENAVQLLSASSYSGFFYNEFSIVTNNLKRIVEKKLDKQGHKMRLCLDLLSFIQGEFLQSQEEPRNYLITSALITLRGISEINTTKEYLQYELTLKNLSYSADY